MQHPVKMCRCSDAVADDNGVQQQAMIGDDGELAKSADTNLYHIIPIYDSKAK